MYNTIDPSSFFLNLLNFENLNNCENTFRIFDGKRRYDVLFNGINMNGNNIECEARQVKIGGYKRIMKKIFCIFRFYKSNLFNEK